MADQKPAKIGCLVLALPLAFLMLLLMIPLLFTDKEEPEPPPYSICGTGKLQVPEQAKPWMAEAEKSSGIPAMWFAAIASRESDFRPQIFTMDSSGGTWGLFQLDREEWSKVYPEGDNPGGTPKGITDPLTHAKYAGIYFKARLEHVKKLKTQYPAKEFAKLSDLDALAVAHNAGEGNLMRYPRLPAITKSYLAEVQSVFSQEECQGSGPPGELFGKDDYITFWKQKAGQADGIDPWSFYWGECVSYTAFAVRTYTRHKDFVNNWKGAHFGNAKEWDEAARQVGIPVDQTPAVGAIVQHNRNAWGHVALITTVHPDGSFDANEYNHAGRHIFGTRKGLRMGRDFDNVLHFEK